MSDKTKEISDSPHPNVQTHNHQSKMSEKATEKNDKTYNLTKTENTVSKTPPRAESPGAKIPPRAESPGAKIPPIPESSSDAKESKEPERFPKLSYDLSKRRESNTSVKSRKSSYSSSSRRGSRVDTEEDEFDENGLPHLPHIMYRKGSIISFPITDDLPCMKPKRHSISSVSSVRTDASEDVPPIAYRKGSFSVVYTIPDLLLKEDPNENESDEKSIAEFAKKVDSTSYSLEPKVKNLHFNELLAEIGGFGKFHLYLLLCLIPYIVSYSFIQMSHKYLTLLPDQYWCNVPALANLSSEQRRNLSIPQNSDGIFDRCRVYRVENDSWPVGGDQLVPDSGWNVTSCQNGWQYQMDDISYASLAAEDSWVCDKSSHTTIAQTIFYLGSILGGFVLSWVADKFGRIPAVLGSNLVGFLGTVLTPFSTEIILFSVSRFLTGVGYFNGLIFFYIIVLEYVAPKWRTFALTIQFLLFYTGSEVALPWIVAMITDWRWIALVMAVPLMIGFLLAFFVPESARWQVATGQIDKAISTLKKVEKVNKTQVDPKLYVQLKESHTREHPRDSGRVSVNVVHIFRTKNLRRNVFACVVIWLSLWFVYSGLMRQPRHFDLNIFTSASLLGLTSFPAFLIVLFTLDVWGRKWLSFGSLFLGALTLLLSTADPTGPLSSVTAIIGRIFLSVTHAVALQYGSEVLPTVVRAQGLNLMHVFGSVASIVSPLILQWGYADSPGPLIILGLIGVFGAFVTIVLPETHCKSLPETIEQGRKMKDETLFDILFCDTDEDE